MVKRASSLSHKLLNVYLFFFMTSVARASNYLANKDRSPHRDQPLKEEKIAFYPLQPFVMELNH